MLTEMGIPVTAAMALEVNALVILVMIICWALHEATAVWDVFYANEKREITPIEQWVHSYLGVLPLLSLVLVVVLNWAQFLALFGFGTATPRFDIVWREPPLPWGYVLSVITAVMLLEVLPYLEELARGLIANGGCLVPRPAVRAVRPERS
jgi:sterol desaturase/sphingolipid hydroxylase (fatty acid hydroxylase superfamily)